MQKRQGKFVCAWIYWKLNFITGKEMLSHYQELLKPYRLSTVVIGFPSFELAQGYLQLAIEESDIKKTAFRAGSTGLYEFTLMLFVLSNVDSSFSHLMEQCLGGQQFVTLLLYLDDI